MVCDDVALQPLLPQVIVTNTKPILRKQLFRFIIESPLNVRRVRRTTAWNTTELQEKAMCWLHATLLPNGDRYAPDMFMDAARARAAP